jgi:DNA invertase Pin-like site-specific DNA recombinase
VKRIFKDKMVSGGDYNRPRMWDAIKELEPREILLVWKHDRLAREVLLMEQIKQAVQLKKGVIKAVEGDLPGNSFHENALRQILSVMAEYERKLVAFRTQKAMVYHQQNGRRMSGHPPYGFRFDENNRLVEVPEEQEVIDFVRTLRRKYPKDTLKIVHALQDSKYTSRSGWRWQRRDVERMISNSKDMK